MRLQISRLILALALAACPLGAQENLIRLAPLVAGPAPASPGAVAGIITAAQSAQEIGIPWQAAVLFQEAVAQSQLPAERRRWTIARVTALLDDGQVDEAEKALNSLSPPYDSAWNLRAGLVQVQKHTPESLVRAGGHHDAIKSEELTAEDKGWYFFLKGRIADAANDAKAKEYFDSAVAAAVSKAQRTRFQLSREQVFARSGMVTAADAQRQRENTQMHRGEVIGFEMTIVYAVELDVLDRRAEAVNVLQAQLTALQPFQQDWRDRTLLFLGLIATTKTEAGRTALLQLLENGSTPDSQRVALLLLVNEPQATAFRRLLDTLIARPVPHPIREDLLMKRAQLSAAEKTPTGYTRAAADAEELRTRFPGSELLAPALALQATMEWEQRRYLGAASFAAQAREAAKDPAARARLRLLEAEAFFRARDPRARAAYEAVLGDLPVDVPRGALLFQRLQAEIEATDFSVADATALLDKLATDPAFDVVNRWQAEWNLARKLRASNQAGTAYRRVNNLLAAPTATAALPPELRARMAWLQAQLSLESGQPETTLQRITALGGALANVAPALAAEIRSTSVLLQGQAEIALGREKEALDTLAQLRREYKTSDAAASSVLIEGDYLKSKDRLTEAQALYRLMEADFPNSPYVPQALYYAALLDDRKGDKREAANRLDALARTYVNSPLVFAARLKQADLYRELKEFGPAQQIYNRLTLDFPNDPRIFDAEMGLADSYYALATTDASSAELAAAKYERLLDLADVPLDQRVRAGYMLGLVRQQQKKPEEALTIWWRDVVTPFLKDENQARKLGSTGRYWMGRTLTTMAELYEAREKLDEAREMRRLLVTTDLPGKEEAARRLAAPAAGAGGP